VGGTTVARLANLNPVTILMPVMGRTTMAYVFPSEIRGQWVAHSLHLDVVSQGDSVGDAIASLEEAVAICVEDDAQGGFDLWDRGPAPDEDWMP